MPISATGTTEVGIIARVLHRPPPGFTLIELLVVLVIFGIALGLVAVRLLPDDLALVRREAQSAALLLERAADDTDSSGRPLAWRASAGGDLFEILDDSGRWKALDGDQDFHGHRLPGDLHWAALTFSGAPPAAPLPRDGGQRQAASNDETAVPRVVFLPGQPAPEFSIELQAGRVRVLLKGNALGEVDVRTLDDGST
jgi:general secretion pathway protein H